MVFQDLCLFPGLSRPGILNNKIPGLSRVCTNPDTEKLSTLTMLLETDITSEMSAVCPTGTMCYGTEAAAAALCGTAYGAPRN